MELTREDAEKLLPIMQALSEGKTLQIYKGGKWIDCVLDSTLYVPEPYRIKPEPKYRPFKNQEECWEEMHKHPDFGWIKNDKELVHICNISKTNNNVIVDFHSDIHYSINVVEVFYKHTFTDGALFGIKEE